MKDTLVFIDAGFLSKLSKYFGKGKYSIYDLIEFSKKLALDQNLICKDIFYYTAPPFQSEPPTPKEEIKREGYDRFIKRLKEKGAIVREGRCQRLKINEEFMFKQKAVDVFLTMDLTNVPIKYPHVKKIIFISSDSDFVPVINNLKELGIKTTLYTYYEKRRDSNFSRSNELIKSVNKYVLLTKKDFDNAPLKRKMNLPLNRDQALELLQKYNPKENKQDWNHYLESEAIMKALAEKLGEDVEYWAMLGLLHDIDWGITKENTIEHLTKAPDILREAGFDDEFINNIISHGCGFECAGLKDKKREAKIQHALAACETLTGLIHAYALMRGGRISDMEVKGLKKKFKDKTFAAGCDRDIIREIEEVGLELDEFFEISINAIKLIKDEVDLE